MQGFLEHIDEAYTAEGQPFDHTDLSLSPADPDGRRITGHFGYGSPNDGQSLVINARPVGGRNAGTFQGWVTLSRAEWRRVTGPRPDGWRSYTCVIGYAPDDETIWWSAVYDDDLLVKMPFEEMEDGRWLRLPPDLADRALVAKCNMLQQTLDLPLPPDEPAPVTTRESVYTAIMSGLDAAMDGDQIKHLSAAQVDTVLERLLMAASYVRRWDNTRESQSYSQAKARRRR